MGTTRPKVACTKKRTPHWHCCFWPGRGAHKVDYSSTSEDVLNSNVTFHVVHLYLQPHNVAKQDTAPHPKHVATFVASCLGGGALRPDIMASPSTLCSTL